jgi:hypothetical protein
VRLSRRVEDRLIRRFVLLVFVNSCFPMPQADSQPKLSLRQTSDHKVNRQKPAETAAAATAA